MGIAGFVLGIPSAIRIALIVVVVALIVALIARFVGGSKYPKETVHNIEILVTEAARLVSTAEKDRDVVEACVHATYALAQLRRDLAVELGVDPDRDWNGGVLREISAAEIEALDAFKVPWFRSLWAGRAIAIVLTLTATITLLAILLG